MSFSINQHFHHPPCSPLSCFHVRLFCLAMLELLLEDRRHWWEFTQLVCPGTMQSEHWRGS